MKISKEVKQLLISLLGATGGVAVALMILDLASHGYWPIIGFERMVIVTVMGLGGFFLSGFIVVMEDIDVIHKEQAMREEALRLILHELRTALTSTGWSIEMVLEKYKENISPDDVNMLKGIINSAHSAVRHSMDLLGINTVKKQDITINLNTVQLVEVRKMIQELVDGYTVGAQRKGIDFSASIELDDTRKAEIDMDQLRVVFENLFENALIYTPKGGAIRVILNNPDNHIHVEVKDTGMGIPETEKSSIFEEFYRASNAKKHLKAGSGIGLYTCKKYIEAHGGKIWFESKEGLGTTFYFDIPQNTSVDVNEFLKNV